MTDITPRFFYLQLATDLNPRILQHPSQAYSSDIVSALPPGPIKVKCEGSRWHPVMENADGALICTSLLAAELRSEGLQLGDEFPVEIVGVEGAIKRKASPDYVYFRCRRGLVVTDEGNAWPQGHPHPDSFMPYRKIACPETWNGDDLFGATDRDWQSLMVTRRFMEAACRKKWDCFAFTALDLPYDLWHANSQVTKGGFAVPQIWYPEGVEPHPANQGPMPVPCHGPVEPNTPQSSNLVGKTMPAVSQDESGRSVPGWQPLTADDEGEPTGYSLLGETVRWADEDTEWSREDRDAVRRLILQNLEPALRIAETYLNQQHDGAGEQEPLEVWQVGVAIATEQPESDTDFHWELNIGANNAGVCPSHFLVFRGSELVDATAAD
jgi:hypothetical protein